MTERALSRVDRHDLIRLNPARLGRPGPLDNPEVGWLEADPPEERRPAPGSDRADDGGPKLGSVKAIGRYNEAGPDASLLSPASQAEIEFPELSTEGSKRRG